MPGTPDSLDAIVAAIRHSGRRVTVAKRWLADALVRADEHLSADELTTLVQRHEPDVSTSTIYRLLDEFEELGLVEHSHLGHTAAVYHLTGRDHAHLVCLTCGATIEIPRTYFDGLSRNLAENYGFEVDRHHTAIPGTCAACRGSTRPSRPGAGG